MKYLSYITLLAFLVVGTTGCLESDDFDGLTDTKPAVAVTFPDREFDQNMGLGYVATGYAGNPNITYTLTLEGGSEDIASILMVEGRAADVNLGACGYAVIEDDEIAVNSNSFDYTRSLQFFLDSDALCAGVLDKPDTYFELIFTIQLTNGEQIVAMPVRGIFKE